MSRPPRSRTRLIPAVLALSLAAGAPTAALSAETAEERDTRLKKAQAYLDLATTLFRDKDFSGALKELQRAEPLLDGSDVQPLVRFNIARCYEELGRPAEAVRAYQRYLTLSEEADRRRDRAREAIRDLEPKAVGTLQVECAQPGTVLRIDGLEQPNRPCPVAVQQLLGGEYTATARADGFQETRRVLVVEPGRTTTHRFDLIPVAVAATDRLDTTTRSNDSGGRNIVPWLVIGAGVGAAATGAVFHSLAASSAEDADNAGSPSEYDTAVQQFESQRIGTITAYGVGAALIGVGVYLLVRDSGDPADAAFIPTGNGALVRF
ncbi:MAG: tetratricopeptide repeat protein [Myxococcales bacterium]|nr:tetratricopeptide repeat protein [Myxococcales bacterium]